MLCRRECFMSSWLQKKKSDFLFTQKLEKMHTILGNKLYL